MNALADTMTVGIDPALSLAPIVVVDDLSANVDLLTRLITKGELGEVHGFTDPLTALEACTQQPPSLVLLDLHMPGLDGVEFIARLRDAIGPRTFVPVIVITADIGGDARRKVLEAGANDFLTKPFDVTEVLLRVRNMLETSRLHTEVCRHADQLQAEINEQLARDADAQAYRQQQVHRIEDAMTAAGMTSVYQPVVDLSTSQIVGAEALARFAGQPVRSPAVWFDEAAEVDMLAELELRAIALALRGLDDLPEGAFMAINCSPATAATNQFANVLAALPAERIVVELTEHTRVNDYTALLSRLMPFVERGGRIAVDDAGSGYAGLTHILQLRPHVIKLDAALTTGIDLDLARRALAQSLVNFADAIGATIIAEGIETAAELATLRELGVHWGQGYYLARPQTLPLELDPAYTGASAGGVHLAGLTIPTQRGSARSEGLEPPTF